MFSNPMRGRSCWALAPLFLADTETTTKDFPFPGLNWRYLPSLIFVLTEAFFTQILQSPIVPFPPGVRLVSFGPGVLVGAAVAVGAGVPCSLEMESEILSTVSETRFPEQPASSTAEHVSSSNAFFFMLFFSFCLKIFIFVSIRKETCPYIS